MNFFYSGREWEFGLKLELKFELEPELELELELEVQSEPGPLSGSADPLSWLTTNWLAKTAAVYRSLCSALPRDGEREREQLWLRSRGKLEAAKSLAFKTKQKQAEEKVDSFQQLVVAARNSPQTQLVPL